MRTQQEQGFPEQPDGKRAVLILAVAVMLLSGCGNAAVGTLGSPAPVTEAARDSIPRWPPVSLLPDEFFPRVVACLNDRGYPVTLGPDYTITASYASADHSMYREARDACLREVDPSYLEDPPLFTDAQLKSLYSYVEAQVACFVELGYPQVESPSFERFSSDLRGRFDPVGALVSDFGVFPDDADIATCRERDKPAWFVAP